MNFLNKLLAFIPAAMVVMVLSLAVLTATLAIPIVHMGFGSSLIADGAITGEQLIVATIAVVGIVALLMLKVLAQTERTGHSPGDAGGRLSRRTSPLSRLSFWPYVGPALALIFSALIAIWASALQAFGRPIRHSFAG